MKRALAFAATTVVLISSVALGQNAITDWNAIGITAARASTAPGSATAGGTGIYLGYVHLAMYNAVNAVSGGFEPYKYSLPASPDASADASAVEAAYRVLLYLLPDQATFLTTEYSGSLSAIPDGDAKTAGQALGLASANALIALRMNDGRGSIVPYSFPAFPVPGVWILTPGATAPQTPWVGQMRPFTFDDPAQFLPDQGPPALDSETWADDYNQVKNLGASNSTVRTPEETEKARFWMDHTASQYGRLLRKLAADRNLSVAATARLFAMSYAALADGFIGCMNAKYHFSFWRPVTAINNGDIDGNSDTVADPNWSPLATTPNHPEYPAAHGCATGALADTLAAYFGTPNLELTIDSQVPGTTIHTFNSIREWQQEVEYARIWAGFHYHHSLVQGFVLGHKVANNLVTNYFRPVR